MVRTMLAQIAKWLQGIFHWKYTSAIGIAMWLVGVSVMASDKYILALVCYAIGGVWVLGWWLTDRVAPKKRKNQKTWNKQQKKQFLARWGGAALIIISTVSVGLWDWRLREEKILGELGGYLIPANDTYQRMCPGDDIEFLAGSYAVIAQRYPLTIMSIEGQPKLVVDKDENGGIAVSVDVFSRDGRIVASLDKNRFDINPNNYFRMIRKDRSTLAVYDQEKREVLYARYINPKAFLLRASLFYPNAGVIEVPSMINRMCLNQGVSSGAVINYIKQH